MKLNSILHQIQRSYKIYIMEDNSKLFVFEKKEVILIFVFIVVISVTAFTLGVRVGKGLSLKHDGYTSEDVKNIDLKSVEEEYVDKVISETPQKNNARSELTENSNENVDEIEQRLREEMEKLAKNNSAQPELNIAEEKNMEETEAVDPALKEPVDSFQVSQKSNDMQGKYTIQLYSNQSKSAAEDFADPFIIKGYNVVINEVTIPSKGTWYRVSIGVFETIEEAKAYLGAEKKLFQSEDYIIQQL